MTITAIKCYPTWQGHRNICLVKVECGELHGWGEAGLSGRELAVAGAVDHYSQFLVGQDGMRIGALWQEMYRSQYFEGGRTLTAAISAIDIALFDCLGPLAPSFSRLRWPEAAEIKAPALLTHGALVRRQEARRAGVPAARGRPPPPHPVHGLLRCRCRDGQGQGGRGMAVHTDEPRQRRRARVSPQAPSPSPNPTLTLAPLLTLALVA